MLNDLFAPLVKQQIKNGEWWIGDCLELMKDISDGSVDMVLCDLPYGEVNRSSSGLRNLDKGSADVFDMNIDELVSEYIRVCSGSFYIFCGIDQISEINSAMKKHLTSTRLGLWEKTNPSPMNGQRIWLSGNEFCIYGKKSNATFNRHCLKPNWLFATTRSKIHPTQKPIALFEYLILSSTNEGDLILDNTAGSGTTAVAAENTSRRWICIERDQEYSRKAMDRIRSC